MTPKYTHTFIRAFRSQGDTKYYLFNSEIRPSFSKLSGPHTAELFAQREIFVVRPTTPNNGTGTFQSVIVMLGDRRET